MTSPVAVAKLSEMPSNARETTQQCLDCFRIMGARVNFARIDR